MINDELLSDVPDVYKDPLETDSSANSSDFVDEEAAEEMEVAEMILEQDFEVQRDAIVSSGHSRRWMVVGGAMLMFVVLSVAVVVPSVVLTRGNKNDKSGGEPISAANNETVKDGEDFIPLEPPTEQEEEPEDIPPLPFPEAKVMEFSEDILKGYANRDELKADLTMAAQSVVNGIIMSNIKRQDDHTHHMRPYPMEASSSSSSSSANATTAADDDEGAEENMDSFASATTSTAMAKNANNNKPPKTKDEDDKKTQEQTELDEDLKNQDGLDPDIVLKDDDYVYAVYGDYVLVWDANGDTVAQLKMPQGKADPWGYKPRAYVNALFQTDDHLLVVTQTFEGRYYRERRAARRNRKLEETEEEEVQQERAPMEEEAEPMMMDDAADGMMMEEDEMWYNHMSPMMSQDQTQVRMYRKPTANSQEMPMVEKQEIQGSYSYGVLMPESNILHIVTSSWLHVFFDGLDVYNFPWHTKEDYAKEAAALASKVLIPKFVDEMLETLVPEDGDMPQNMMRINSWNYDILGSDNGWYDASFISRYNQISSVHVGSGEGGMMRVSSTSSFFGPHVSGSVGQDSSLVLSMRTSQYDRESQRNNQTIFLVSLLQSTTGGTSFHSLAQVQGGFPDGMMQPKAAMDIQGHDVRLAVTNTKWHQYDVVWRGCGDVYYFEDKCMTNDNWMACSEAAYECGGQGLVKSGGCPYTTFECEGEKDASRTENYIIVLDLTEPGEMVEHGRVKVGNPNEIITTVFFDESHAFVTTFNPEAPERHFGYHDPYYHEYNYNNGNNNNAEPVATEAPELPEMEETFYTVDIPTGGGPTVQNEVVFKEGVRTQLRPLEVSEDRTLLLGLGRNITAIKEMMMMDMNMPMELMMMMGMGMSNTGLVFTVFDVTNPSNPQILATQLMVNSTGYDANSEAEWDPKTIGLHDGFLVVPLRMYPMYHYNQYGHDGDHHYEEEMYHEMMEEGFMHDDMVDMDAENMDGEDVSASLLEEIEELEAEEEREAEKENVTPAPSTSPPKATRTEPPVAPMPMPMDPAMEEWMYEHNMNMTQPMEDFNGFIVYDVRNVAEKGIVEAYRVKHNRRGNGEEPRCHYCSGYFQGSRSYVFDGSNGEKILATVAENYFVGTNLLTGEELWAVAPTIEGEDNGCCRW